MQGSFDRQWFFVSVLTAMLAAGLASVSAQATEVDMAKLPIVEPFRCAICHVHDDPIMQPRDLNVFGLDFLDNGRQWNAYLAAIDSDGDGCTNGLELGDKDGDGIPDGNMSVLTSNPGVEGDCGELLIDVRTWGALKRLFDRR